MLETILVLVLIVILALCVYPIVFWFNSRLYSNIVALERKYTTREPWGEFGERIRYWIQDEENDSFTNYNSRCGWCKIRPDGILFICSCTFPYWNCHMLIPFSIIQLTREIGLSEFQAFPITLLAGSRFLEIKVQNSPARIIIEEKHAEKLRNAMTAER